jgi:hypothetical protein
VPPAWVLAGPKDDRSDALSADYAARFDALKTDDIAGHLELAEWCKAEKAFKLLKRQCQHILSRDADSKQADLLMKFALRELNESAGGETTSEGTADGSGDGRLPRLVTEEEIQRIRWEELDEKDAREDRQAFIRLSPTEKAQKIKELSKLKDLGDRFSVDITLRSDPRRLADFERRVWPLVLGNCATSGCHGGVSRSPFLLYTDAVLNKEKVYTNYLLMHNYRVAGKPLIDRQSPDRSLLLTYGLLELSANLDPSYKHAVELKSPFRGPSDSRYKTIHEWISSLSPIAPDYGGSHPAPPASP